MRTYIDEGALWLGTAEADTQRDAIDDTCDLLEEVVRHPDEVLLWSEEAYGTEVREGETLTDVLYPVEHEAGLRDAVLRLAMTLQKAKSWEDPEWDVTVDDFDVSVEGTTRFAPTLAQANAVAQSGEPTCIVGFSTACASGPRSTVVADREAVVWRATDCTSRLLFVRSWLLARAPAPVDFLDYLDRAFPDLCWAGDAKNGLRSHSSCFFGTDFPVTMHHLSVLNDDAASIFASESEPAVRGTRLAALDVKASPASPNTRQNKEAKRERRRKWRDQDVYFWWHTKIRYNQGRIHFLHEDAEGDADAPHGRIVIGICTEHLST